MDKNDISSQASKLSAAKRALLEKRLQGKFTGTSKAQVIPQRPERSPTPVSFGQQRLWFCDQLTPGNPCYNLPMAVRLSGSLNLAALEQAFNEILRRHESLRTIFARVDGQPVQVIAPTQTLKLPVVDLSELPETERSTEAQRLATEEAEWSFDLVRGPLWRVKLLCLASEEHVLLLTMYHIISDSWSLGVLWRELAALYEAFLTGKPSPLPELPIQYADFAHWQQQRMQGEVLEAQLDYWKQQLGGTLPVLQLPTDRPRPSVQTYRGATQSLVLPKTLTEALKTLSRQERVTIFMTLLAAFQTLLSRYTGQEDILVGSPIAGRNQVETEGLIGFFVNNLVIRTYLGGNPTFRELIGRVREVALGAYAHQDLPFEKLVKELQPERDLSRSPLFQVVFDIENTPMPALELSGLILNSQAIHNGTAQYDLLLELQETKEGISGWFLYNTDLFDGYTVHRMAEHFQTLLEGVVANPEQRLSDLPLLTAAERQLLLVEWNHTQAKYPKDACIHQVFETQVERTPNAVAVVFEDKQLTYRELNARANQLAHYLRSLGVGPDVLVGICMQRSLEMVVGLLGILKAGGAYVPLDPAYPQSRLAFMLEDAQVSVLLTQKQLVEGLPNHSAKVVCLDFYAQFIAQEREENPLCAVRAENLAYVMYTSGSTGRPKGVSIIHQGVVRLACGADYANLTSQEVFLQLAPISFDASTFEIWGSLLNGARLVVFPAHTPSLEELGQVVQLHQITTLWLSAGLFHLMVDERLEDLKSVRQLLAGGDVLSVPHVQKVLLKLEECKLINGYGPTESTTFTCSHLTRFPTHLGTSVPIGRPIANTQVYILDRYLKPVPIKVPGELYIGGSGLARGYLNQPQLTAEQFIPHPYSNQPGARLYKTGDIAQYLPDGNIEFLGRTDHQVKLRGFRIELGEIEAALSQHPSVRTTVVLVREDQPGDKRIVAYVVPNQAGSTLDELRCFLQEKLPQYMVPSAFMMLDTLPLTPNGKVDRRALPPPLDQTRPELERAFLTPQDTLELELTQIWEKVLGIQPIGVRENFFELGGHSLLALRLFAQIEKTFGKNLSLATLFQAPTVEQQASLLRESERSAPWSSLVTIQTGNSKRPLFCVLNLVGFLDLARLLGPEQPFYGLTIPNLDEVQNPETAIKDIAAQYIDELRAVQPEGPYLLGGLCFGSIVAFEMAQQLQAQGQKVALLALLEPMNLFPTNVLSSNFNRFVYHLRKLLQLDPAGRLTYIFEKARRIKSNILPKARVLYNYKAKLAYDKIRIITSSYVLQPYQGRITLFLSDTYLRLSPTHDPRWGWSQIAVGGLEVYDVPGDHASLLNEPHVQVLAEKFRACLDQAQADD